MTLSEMNVARWEKDGAITIMSTPIPTLKPGEMLIKVAASGLCGKFDSHAEECGGTHGVSLMI